MKRPSHPAFAPRFPLLRRALSALSACNALVAAALLAASGPSASAQTLTAPERAALLERLESIKAKHPSLQANFTEERTSRLLKKPVSSAGTIAFHAPNKFRREVTGSSPSLTVSNGSVLWLYYPNFKEAELYTLGHRAMFDDAMAALTAGLNFGKVEAFYNLDVAHENPGYRVTLTPKKSNLKRIVQQLTVILDADLNVTRTDFQMPKGDRVSTVYANPRRTDLPAATFEFIPPADANVSRPLGK